MVGRFTSAQSIPGGYMLGRLDAGSGRVDLVPISRVASSVASVMGISGPYVAGAGITVTGNLVAITTGQLPATTTNDSASAGKVGEYISSTVLIGSEINLTNITTANVTSISLTAGDWDVHGNVAFDLGAGTTCTEQIAAISTTSATLPTIPASGAYAQQSGSVVAGVGSVIPTGERRVSVASTTTVYLVAQATFAVSTAAAYGFIGARRAR